MSLILEGRLSDSPYVEMIWRGQAGKDCYPICPADSRWNMHMLRENGKTRVAVEGAMTKAIPLSHSEGAEWLTIKFKVGVFVPHLSTSNMLNGRVVLPEAARKSYWLYSSTWQFPDYDDVEIFVARLIKQGLLARDPVVEAALLDQPQPLSVRSMRRHFLRATGLTRSYIRQIERAQHAVSRLEKGDSILDVAYEAGYSDQSHMTRALKHLMGRTPAQIVPINK